MKWHTEVEIKPLKDRIKYEDEIFCLGSCFAGEIGAIMQNLRFKITVNPFGVLFNPGSVAMSIGRLMSRTQFREEELILSGDVYKSFNHGSEFASLSKEEFLKNNNAILEKASESFSRSGWIILTLGTSWVYKLKESREIVSNCHKLPDSLFERVLMEPDEIFSAIDKCVKDNPGKRWILTVSPVRHLKDGAHGNQLSKARLLLAVERLAKENANVFYFPAYEIFMDELRDYRFYASDMVHPSQESIKYIWESFVKFAIDEGCRGMIKQVTDLNNLMNHRILIPGSTEHKKLLEKIEALRKKIESELLI